MDTLIPRKISKVSTKDISEHLQEHGFKHKHKDLQNPPTESYIKEINGVEIEVEFLTSDNVRKDKLKNLQVGGIVAQPLSYLELSLKTTTPFTTSSGQKGFVVSPASWIFHKGLTFPKRKNATKKLKDFYGIWYVLNQLGQNWKPRIRTEI